MQAIKKQKYTEVQLESYKRGDKMSNNVPVLMLRGSDGKFFPVAGITGTGGGGGGTGGGSGSGGGMNSAFGATGKDFYAVRLVYKDDEQASKFILNDYSSIIYDAIDNVQNGENYTVTINLTLPEDRNADYNEETADEKRKKS